MSDHPVDRPDGDLPPPPEPQPDESLIGYYERGYPGPRTSTEQAP
jgi:hypothetical protein